MPKQALSAGRGFDIQYFVKIFAGYYCGCYRCIVIAIKRDVIDSNLFRTNTADRKNCDTFEIHDFSCKTVKAFHPPSNTH